MPRAPKAKTEQEKARNREYSKRWRDRNVELARKQGREHKAEVYAADPDRARAYKRSYYERNRDKIRAQQRVIRQRKKALGIKQLPRAPELTREFHLRHNFGITAAQYDEMLAAQRGACAICHLPCSTGRRLAVDHDHVSGEVRGLLCANCNRGIGLLKDDPTRVLAAAKYLSR